MTQTKCTCRSPLGPRICTNKCPERAVCKVRRVPFLIPVVLINRSQKKVYIDKYINELAYNVHHVTRQAEGRYSFNAVF